MTLFQGILTQRRKDPKKEQNGKLRPEDSIRAIFSFSRFPVFSLSHLPLMLLVASLAVVCLSCTGSQQEKNGKVGLKKVKPAQAKFEEESGAVTLAGVGILEAGKTVPVLSSVEGEISWLAKEGSYVKEGDLVARLTCKEIEDEHDQTSRDLAKAEAELKKGEQNLQAVKRDAKERLDRAELKLKFAELQMADETPKADDQGSKTVFPTKEKVDRAQRIFFNAQASNANAIRAARKNIRIKEHEFLRLQKKLKRDEEKLQLLSLKAPADGVVVFANLDGAPPVQAAQMASPSQKTASNRVQIGDSRWRGAEVLRIAVPTDLCARIHVRESDLDYLKLNQTAKVVVDGQPNETYEGKVVEVFPHSEECNAPLNNEAADYEGETEGKEDSSGTAGEHELSQSTDNGEIDVPAKRKLEGIDEGVIDVIIRIEGVAEDVQLGAKVRAAIDVSREPDHK